MTEPWVPTSRTITQDGTTTTIEITTDIPTTLYLCTQPVPPVKNAIVVIRRGEPVICGFYLTYANPTCYLQTEPGATTTHTWAIPTPDHLAETWATATESSPPSWRSEQTVPFTLTPDVIVPALPTICLTRSTNIIVGNGGLAQIAWEAITWQRDWPYTLADPVHVPWPASGYVQLVAQVPWQTASNTAIWLEAATNAQPRFIRSVAATNQAGQNSIQQISAILHAHADDVIEFDLRSDGTINMQTAIGGVQVCYAAMHYLSFD